MTTSDDHVPAPGVTRRSLLAGAVGVAAAAALADPTRVHAAGADAAAAFLGPSPLGVVPAIQEWTGGTGILKLRTMARVVTAPGASARLTQIAGQLVSDARELLGWSLTTATGTSAAGDIVLAVDVNASYGGALADLKGEAYRLAVNDRVQITAGDEAGAYYGTRSLLQALLAASDQATLSQGTAIDYPNYPVRGFMLDVGRRFFTPKFITAYINWMGWLKLNTFHLHLNDNEINPSDWSTAYQAFRLKTDNPAFAGLAAADGAYSRSDWDAFEDAAAANALTIIPEFDAPAHARAFTAFKPSIGMNGGKSDLLDLSNPDATAFMKSVFAEFTPWFRGPTVHMGADEYPTRLAGQYKTYVNTVAEYIRALGKKPAMWGSITSMSGSAAGYDRNIIVESWNDGWYGPKEALADGYQVINTNDSYLYVVPFASYYHPHGLDPASILADWEPHVFPDNETLTPQQPGLLGAMPAVWNDLVHATYTELDVHQLVGTYLAACSTKTWSGTKAGSDAGVFLGSAGTVGQGPGTSYLPNPLATPADPDLARGKATTTSSTETSAFPASYATDGSPATRWSSAYSNDQWLAVDLGSPQYLGRARLNWETAYGKDYDIQTSPDGSAWTTVASRRGLSGPGVDNLVLTHPVTARYVRMRGITRGTGWGYSLWAFEVRAPADQALRRPTSASSTETSAFPASYATDGLPSTRWSSAYTNDQWLAVDLGASPQTYGSARLTWEAAYGKDYDIQTSPDGSAWTTVASRRGLAGPGTDTLTFAATTARYVRMHGITRGTRYGYSLYAFEVR
ncbi:discoidin domain-containing protein [Streptomyces herbicida]|uniref:discoidin domain-containing protein n=1 Tax=Streptomyces herbicida TaxID=3065675 RepID=UPI00292DFB66|nr:discoidin domain-containing protein [Streptomyces sp. NEAU-HV9]